MIVINCPGSDTIQLHELTEFQGELKERSAGDVEKIIKSIKKHGFSFPFFVWKNDGKNNVIDGHGRLKALQQMAAACEKLNRTAYVNEIDPHYCDVIRKRWTKWAEENGVDAGSGALE